ncbi:MULTISPECIES: 50S ribosomal protein L33 [Myxococcus]|nr:MULTISPECIES: 50S ribosomal protein L33 [Myxococcus]NOK05581.1 50S ribosomal protein L33 [Myxococcus xanthus]
MPKGNRTISHLVSSAGPGYVYTEKLQLKKYDPRVRKHVLFVEGKP